MTTGDFCYTNLLDLFVMLQVESFPLFPMSTVQSVTAKQISPFPWLALRSAADP